MSLDIVEFATVLSPVLIAIITGLFSIKQAKMEKEISARYDNFADKIELRKKESLLSMKMASANTKLTIGVAMALKTGHANGEIEEGLKAVQEAENEYKNFLRKVAVDSIES